MSSEVALKGFPCLPSHSNLPSTSSSCFELDNVQEITKIDFVFNIIKGQIRFLATFFIYSYKERKLRLMLESLLVILTTFYSTFYLETGSYVKIDAINS